MEVTKQSPLSVALSGIQRESQKIAKNVAEIAQYGTSPEGSSTRGLAEPLVEITISEQSIRAQTTVIKKLQDMEEDLLNIIA